MLSVERSCVAIWTENTRTMPPFGATVVFVASCVHEPFFASLTVTLVTVFHAVTTSIARLPATVFAANLIVWLALLVSACPFFCTHAHAIGCPPYPAGSPGQPIAACSAACP